MQFIVVMVCLPACQQHIFAVCLSQNSTLDAVSSTKMGDVDRCKPLFRFSLSLFSSPLLCLGLGILNQIILCTLLKVETALIWHYGCRCASVQP